MLPQAILVCGKNQQSTLSQLQDQTIIYFQ